MKKMKIKALTLMRNDTENKKSRAGPFYLNGLAWLSFFTKMAGRLGCEYRLLDI